MSVYDTAHASIVAAPWIGTLGLRPPLVDRLDVGTRDPAGPARLHQHGLAGSR